MRNSSKIRFELARKLLRSTGEVRPVARGGSMLPAIWPGDTLVVRSAAMEAVRAGEIVVSMRGEYLCAHRVVGECFESGRRVLITKGDSLPSTDLRTVSEAEYLGRVSSVVRGGKQFEPAPPRTGWQDISARILQKSKSATTAVLRIHAACRRAKALLRRAAEARSIAMRGAANV
jgi:signal peptidase I